MKHIVVPASYELAQVNVALMRGGFNDPVMAGLAARIEDMNRLAEISDGFVWRWRGSLTSECVRTLGVKGDARHVFYNMSVWETIEQLWHYTFRTAHAEMLRDRRRWIADAESARLALWWIPRSHRPTVPESAARLRTLWERGPTSYAFNFSQSYPPPAE